MKAFHWLGVSWSRYVEKLNLRLANPENTVYLALLGAATGVMTGGVMIVFRILIQTPQLLLFGVKHSEAFEDLPMWLRLLTPAGGGVLLGILFHRLRSDLQEVGVMHTIARLAHSDGHLPFKNAVVQFWSAALCIVSGQSVGREGPSIHVGAACGSWMGQRLSLPNNSIRVLVGCGAAGAIAASFNTPLAGVIFSMEVVMGEYTLAGFTPIILAAVSATAVSRWAFGGAPVFDVLVFKLESLADLGYVVVMGVLIGGLSVLFIRLMVLVTRRTIERPVVLRFALAGLFTGALAVMVPEVLGVGYDTVNAILGGELGLGLLVALLVCKLLASAVGLGLGLPAGIIGPAVVIGAVAGSALGHVFNALEVGSASSPAFYAMLGMGAMMGATVNAPLAALTALLELTANPHIILPGMLAIVAAQLVSRPFFGSASVFLIMMQVRGMSYERDPLSQYLRRLGVARYIDRNTVEVPRKVERSQLESALATKPNWLLVEGATPTRAMLPAADLALYLESQFPGPAWLDLDEVPLPVTKASAISAQATLWGALRAMEQQGLDALYVVLPRGDRRVLGVITRADIERSYQLPPGRPRPGEATR